MIGAPPLHRPVLERPERSGYGLPVPTHDPNPRRRRRERDPVATRQAILDAARAMMAEHGPTGLTLSDVARRARVNRGTAYQHFATRDELIATVLDETFRSTKSALDASVPASLNDRIDQTVRYLVEQPDVVRVALFRMLAGVPNPREDLWADYVGRVRHLLEGPRSRASTNPDVLAVILLGATMLWSMRVEAGAEHREATGDYLRELKRVLLYGVIRPEAHPDVVRAVRTPKAVVRAPKAAPRGRRTAR